MTAAEEILGEDAVTCELTWLRARDLMVQQTEKLMELGVHKQLANRLLEPFMWHKVINSATEYSNFFALRDDANAHPDIQIAARLMRELYEACSPKFLTEGQWHAPYAQGNDELGAQLREITSGRCARVSYLTHDGASDPAADIALHDRLLESGHMSPLEHAARPMNEEEYHVFFKQPKVLWDKSLSKFIHMCDFPESNDPVDDGLYTHFCGNFQGWVSYRKEIPYEDDYATYRKNLQNK